MTTFVPVDPATATGKAGDLLAAVKAKLGIVPNMTRHMARSPAVLEAYLAMNGALAGGTLGARLREQIALATAQANDCDYCLSAHSLIGKGAGLGDADIAKARDGRGHRRAASAVLRFVARAARLARAGDRARRRGDARGRPRRRCHRRSRRQRGAQRVHQLLQQRDAPGDRLSRSSARASAAKAA